MFNISAIASNSTVTQYNNVLSTSPNRESPLYIYKHLNHLQMDLLNSQNPKLSETVKPFPT